MVFGRTRVPNVMGCPLPSDSPAVTVNINTDPDFFPERLRKTKEKPVRMVGVESKTRNGYFCIYVYREGDMGLH